MSIDEDKATDAFIAERAFESLKKSVDEFRTAPMTSMWGGMGAHLDSAAAADRLMLLCQTNREMYVRRPDARRVEVIVRHH